MTTTIIYICVLVHVGSDSSVEDSSLAAAGTQAVAIKKTGLRGHNPRPQECDTGTAKTVLRNKPSQTSPSGGKFY